MARGKKTGGKDFTVGHSVRSGGPGPLPPEIKQIALKTKKEALALLGEMLQKPFDEIVEIFKDGSRSGFDHVLASIIVHTKKGSSRHLQEMFDRLYGKVPQATDIKLTMPEPLYVEYADGTGVALLSETKVIEGSEE